MGCGVEALATPEAARMGASGAADPGGARGGAEASPPTRGTEVPCGESVRTGVGITGATGARAANGTEIGSSRDPAATDAAAERAVSGWKKAIAAANQRFQTA